MNHSQNWIKAEREAINKVDDEISILNFKIDTYTSLYQKLEKAFKMMKDIKAALGQEKNTRNELTDLRKKLDSLKEQIDERTKEVGVKI